MASFSVIIPAAGKSSRFKDDYYKKPFIPLENRAVWLHSVEKFLNRDDVKQLILVISAEDRQEFQEKFAANVAILGIEVAAAELNASIDALSEWKKLPNTNDLKARTHFVWVLLNHNDFVTIR